MAGPIMKNSLTGEPISGARIMASLNEIDELVHQLRTLNRTIEDLEAERDAIKDLLKEQMGDIQELRGEDYKILYTPVQQERIDSKKLRATYPEIAAEVTKTVSYRRFEVK